MFSYFWLFCKVSVKHRITSETSYEMQKSVPGYLELQANKQNEKF